MGDWGNTNVVWRKYLKDKGFTQHAVPNSCPDCYTVKDFAAEHPRGTYILSVGANGGNHAVTVINGDYFDSWDSGNEIVLFYYRRA